jgi:hypothetical protein
MRSKFFHEGGEYISQLVYFCLVTFLVLIWSKLANWTASLKTKFVAVVDAVGLWIGLVTFWFWIPYLWIQESVICPMAVTLEPMGHPLPNETSYLDCFWSMIWGSHGGECEDGRLVGCSAVWSVRSVPTFRKYFLPTSSERSSHQMCYLWLVPYFVHA